MKNGMKPLMAATALYAMLAFSSASFAVQAESASDADYKEKILGHWKYEIVQESVTTKGLYTYQSDGILIVDAMLTMSGQKIPIKLSAVWEIKNGMLVAVLKESNVPQMLPVGTVTKDKIVEINDTVFRFVSEDGKVEHKARVQTSGSDAAETPNRTDHAMRLWTDSSGKFKIEATLKELKKGQPSQPHKAVLQKSDGSLIQIPLNHLSAADQDYLHRYSSTTQVVPIERKVTESQESVRIGRTIEMEIIKGLSAGIKVSERIERIPEPALSKCFASPFYIAEIVIWDLVYKEKRTFAKTDVGMVMISKPSTGKVIPELLELLNPDFTLKTEEDGQAMLSALKAIDPSYVKDGFTPRMEKRGNQWVFILKKFFKKFSGFAVLTDERGKILRISRSLNIQEFAPREPEAPDVEVGELEGAAGSIAVSPGDLAKLKDEIALDGKFYGRQYAEYKSGKEAMRISTGSNVAQFETGATPGKANVRIKGTKKFVDGVISEVKEIIGVEVELSRLKLIAETRTYPGFLQSRLAALDQELAKTMTLQKKTGSGEQLIAATYEKGLNGVRLDYSEEKVSLKVTIEGGQEFVDEIKSLLNKVKETN